MSIAAKPFLPRMGRGQARLALALIGLVVGADRGWAQTTIDCTSAPGALAMAANGGTLNGVINVKGTCVGSLNIFNDFVTIQADVSGGEINGAIDLSGKGVTFQNITIDGTGASDPFICIQLIGGAIGTRLINVTIENSSDSGISANFASDITIDGGSKIMGNANEGVYASTGATVQLGDVEITGNGTSGANTVYRGGVKVESGAKLLINSGHVTNIHDDNNGPELRVSQAVAEVHGGTFKSPSIVTTVPTILVEQGALILDSVLVEGSGHSNAILATPNGSVKLTNSTIEDAAAGVAVIQISDGSTLLSVGGSVICAGTIGDSGCTPTASGNAITVTNASTFKQRDETNLGFPLFFDSFIGAGTVQVESNMELGTGASQTSDWTGTISVAQNSSLRMDGGIMVTGAVKLTQASNGFFNVSNGGENIVTGGVTCPATTTPSAHVAGNTVVLLAHMGSSAVTIGNTPPNCLGF
ncbi:MAG TPA: hypothetical protein VN802_12805 [Stellaceae bacterium]|nr:hypothetical protein [Stellaceae bacterium]